MELRYAAFILLCCAMAPETSAKKPKMEYTCLQGGWKLYKQTCFMVSSNKATVADARSACKARRADLATISGSAENAFLTKNTGASSVYYIGLYKLTAAVGGATKWRNGSTSTYRNYAPGEPDSTGVAFKFSGGLWYDDDGTAEVKYICMKDALPRCVQWLYRAKHRKLCGWRKAKKNRSRFVRRKQTWRKEKLERRARQKNN